MKGYLSKLPRLMITSFSLYFNLFLQGSEGLLGLKIDTLNVQLHRDSITRHSKSLMGENRVLSELFSGVLLMILRWVKFAGGKFAR
jgi:hypothetical protein